VKDVRDGIHTIENARWTPGQNQKCVRLLGSEIRGEGTRLRLVISSQLGKHSLPKLQLRLKKAVHYETHEPTIALAHGAIVLAIGEKKLRIEQ